VTSDDDDARDSGGDATVVARGKEGRDTPPARVKPGRDSNRIIDDPKDDYAELAVVERAHYVIAREIARGGMGRIFSARDRRLGRRVAIKEVLSADDVLARRFEREARITARLQHPSIISVLEAGTWPSGHQFYAMPLVSGRSLDEAIGATNSFEERLGLVPNVLAIADAMAYAHGQRVIHRDLKPRNVVVGEFGETIVIDWGVAKHLDGGWGVAHGRSAASAATISDSGSNSETSAGDLLGTPAYMPPEQASGPAVDERADVYAIGAILYHVLAGQPPYVATKVSELFEQLATRPPVPLAERAPDAPTELVAIVEHAMARDPAKRYPTARELADDLHRFQTGQLVGAHRYSLRQLLLRWIRRHITAIAALVAAVVVGLAIGAFALAEVVDAERDAQDQRARAVASRKDAEGLLDFMLVDLKTKLQKVGRLDLLDPVSRRAAGYYDTHGALTDEDELLYAAARSGIASVLEQRGDLAAAGAEFEKAKASLDRLAAKRPDVVRYRQRAVDAQYDIARIKITRGDLPGAMATARDALAHAEQLRVMNPTDPAVLHDVSIGHSKIAYVLEQLGKTKEALAEQRVNIAYIATRNDHFAAKDALNAHAHLGRLVYWADNDLEAALVETRLGLAIGERELAKDPKDTQWMTDVAISHREVGNLLKDKQDVAGALAEYHAALAISERLAKLDPASTDWQVDLGIAHEKLGNVLFEQQHDVARATVEYEASYAIWSDLAPRDPDNANWQRQTSVIVNKVGDVRLAAKDATAANDAYRRALAMREKLVAKDPSNAQWRRDLFYSHIKLAGLYESQKQQGRAIVELRAALVIAEETARANPTNESSQRDVAATLEGLGDRLVETGDLAGARAPYTASLLLAERFAGQPRTDPSWSTLLQRLTTKLQAPKAHKPQLR